MNTYSLTSAHLCSCSHSHLLAYGETCETCMGVLPVERELEKVLPQPIYDAQYFEEFEAYLERESSRKLDVAA